MESIRQDCHQNGLNGPSSSVQSFIFCANRPNSDFFFTHKYQVKRDVLLCLAHVRMWLRKCEAKRQLPFTG